MAGTNRPGADPGADGDPDYRFTLANERTYLAWMRTAIGLLAAGVGVAYLSGFDAPGRTGLAAVLVVLAMATAGLAYRHWRNNDRAIRAGDPLPRPPMIAVLSVALTIVAIWALVGLFRS
jgi:putative membrane protein